MAVSGVWWMYLCVAASGVWWTPTDVSMCGCEWCVVDTYLFPECIIMSTVLVLCKLGASLHMQNRKKKKRAIEHCSHLPKYPERI